MEVYTACLIGQGCVRSEKELRPQLCAVIEELIVDRKVESFLVGEKNEFDRLCNDVLSEMVKKYPQIKRIFCMSGSKYTERYFKMIDNSRYCVFYYNIDNEPQYRRSGAKIALDYAKRKRKKMVVLG